MMEENESPGERVESPEKKNEALTEEVADVEADVDIFKNVNPPFIQGREWFVWSWNERSPAISRWSV